MGEGRLAFGGFVVDGERGVLFKDGAPVAVSQRGLALLKALLEADGRPVEKSALMDIAWPGQVVEESNLTVQIAALRKSLGNRPDGQEWIATVPRVGYQFAALSEKPASREMPADPRPSIAVLPFTNFSANPDHAFIAEGMTDDIIAALSRVGELFVISRSSGIAAKARGLSARQAAQELGVRYVLDGSIQVAGNRIRVMPQLTDSLTDNAVWADRYEGTLDDVFAFQDDLTRNIAQALQITLSRGESARLWEGQTRNLRAWEKVVQGMRAFQRFTTADNDMARRLLEEAIALDPAYTSAVAWLGITHLWDARYSVSVSRPEALAKADRCIAAIEALNPELPQLLALKAYTAMIRGDHSGAVRWGEAAVARAPGDSRAQGFLGIKKVYGGDMQGALVSLTHAMRHSPLPDIYHQYYLAIVHMWLGNLDKALDNAVAGEKLVPGEPCTLAYLAAIHVLRGEEVRAKAAIQRLREATPSYGLRNIRHSELYRDPQYLDRLTELLRAAGLPD